MSTQINVKYIDNELLLIASTPHGSSTLAHLKSGNGQVTPFTLDARSILAPGEYTLQMIGINWGMGSRFLVEVGGQTFDWVAPGETVVTKSVKLKV